MKERTPRLVRGSGAFWGHAPIVWMCVSCRKLKLLKSLDRADLGSLKGKTWNRKDNEISPGRAELKARLHVDHHFPILFLPLWILSGKWSDIVHNISVKVFQDYICLRSTSHKRNFTLKIKHKALHMKIFVAGLTSSMIVTIHSLENANKRTQLNGNVSYI